MPSTILLLLPVPLPPLLLLLLYPSFIAILLNPPHNLFDHFPNPLSIDQTLQVAQLELDTPVKVEPTHLSVQVLTRFPEPGHVFQNQSPKQNIRQLSKLHRRESEVRNVPGTEIVDHESGDLVGQLMKGVVSCCVGDSLALSLIAITFVRL